MKFGKLAVSLTAAAVMGAYGSAFAQNTSTYSTSSSSGNPADQPNAVLDSDTYMRNTDQNAPSSVKQEQGSDMTSQGSSSSYSSDSATPQAGSSSSMDSSSSSSDQSSSSIDHDQPQSFGKGSSSQGDSGNASSGISGGSESVTE